MYDKLFSPQWVMDQCLSPYNFPLVAYILPLFVFIILFLLIWREKHKKLRLKFLFILISVGICTYIIYFFAIVYIGFSICDTRMFFKGINGAHVIHAGIKDRFHDNVDIPQSLSDLQKINPDMYKLMTENAKVAYVADKEKKTYTLFVRPSKYVVVVFDNVNDFKIYGLDMNADMRFNPQHNFYPPSYPGPWDKLPK